MTNLILKIYKDQIILKSIIAENLKTWFAKNEAIVESVSDYAAIQNLNQRQIDQAMTELQFIKIKDEIKVPRFKNFVQWILSQKPRAANSCDL